MARATAPVIWTGSGSHINNVCGALAQHQYELVTDARLCCARPLPVWISWLLLTWPFPETLTSCPRSGSLDMGFHFASFNDSSLCFWLVLEYWSFNYICTQRVCVWEKDSECVCVSYWSRCCHTCCPPLDVSRHLTFSLRQRSVAPWWWSMAGSKSAHQDHLSGGEFVHVSPYVKFVCWDWSVLLPVFCFPFFSEQFALLNSAFRPFGTTHGPQHSL